MTDHSVDLIINTVHTYLLCSKENFGLVQNNIKLNTAMPLDSCVATTYKRNINSILIRVWDPLCALLHKPDTLGMQHSITVIFQCLEYLVNFSIRQDGNLQTIICI